MTVLCMPVLQSQCVRNARNSPGLPLCRGLSEQVVFRCACALPQERCDERRSPTSKGDRPGPQPGQGDVEPTLKQQLLLCGNTTAR